MKFPLKARHPTPKELLVCLSSEHLFACNFGLELRDSSCDRNPHITKMLRGILCNTYDGDNGEKP